MAQERCKLMGGTFENFVQFLLFVIVMSVLWFKRWRERPRRSYKIWFMDIFKQICSGTEAHLINLGVSTLLGDASSTSNKVDDCEWYFVNFSLDTTVGLMLTFFSLKGVERMARRRDWTSLKVSGEYGTPPSYRVGAKQVSERSAGGVEENENTSQRAEASSKRSELVTTTTIVQTRISSHYYPLRTLFARRSSPAGSRSFAW